MTAAPLPASGEIFLDARGDDRVLRVTWHSEAAVVVLSLWRKDTRTGESACAGSFRLPVTEVPAFIELLRAGLSASYGVHRDLVDRTEGTETVAG